jgi:hypothetical protein
MPELKTSVSKSPKPEVSKSPKPAVVIEVPKGVDFPSAMKEVIAGKKVCRLEWQDDSYGILKDGLLMIVIAGVEHKWIVTDGDMLPNDWIVTN